MITLSSIVTLNGTIAILTCVLFHVLSGSMVTGAISQHSRISRLREPYHRMSSGSSSSRDTLMAESDVPNVPTSQSGSNGSPRAPSAASTTTSPPPPLPQPSATIVKTEVSVDEQRDSPT